MAEAAASTAANRRAMGLQVPKLELPPGDADRAVFVANMQAELMGSLSAAMGTGLQKIEQSFTEFFGAKIQRLAKDAEQKYQHTAMEIEDLRTRA